MLVDLTLHMADNRLALVPASPRASADHLAGLPQHDRRQRHRLSPKRCLPRSARPDRRVLRRENDPTARYILVLRPDERRAGDCRSQRTSVRIGYITFGCLNNFAKVTDATLNLWGRVMQGVPNSRLILLAPSGSARRRVINSLAKHDVAEGSNLLYRPFLPRSRLNFADASADRLRSRYDSLRRATRPHCDALWSGQYASRHLHRTQPPVSRGCAATVFFALRRARRADHAQALDHYIQTRSRSCIRP